MPPELVIRSVAATSGRAWPPARGPRSLLRDAGGRRSVGPCDEGQPPVTDESAADAHAAAARAGGRPGRAARRAADAHRARQPALRRAAGGAGRGRGPARPPRGRGAIRGAAGSPPVGPNDILNIRGVGPPPPPPAPALRSA